MVSENFKLLLIAVLVITTGVLPGLLVLGVYLIIKKAREGRELKDVDIDDSEVDKMIEESNL